MPRKKGNSRGSSRGGARGGSSRGGHGGRGGSRGGGSNYGRFYLSKSARRKGKGRFNPGGSNGYDDPEFMDLGSGQYMPAVDIDSSPAPSSMKALSRRPNRSMVEEARYTDRHSGHTMKEPLRNKPLVFVKSVEVYDPSKLTVDKLLKKEPIEITEELQSLRMNDDESVSPEGESDSDAANEEVSSSGELSGPGDETPKEESSESAKESDGETEAEKEIRSSDDDQEQSTIDVQMAYTPEEDSDTSVEQETEPEYNDDEPAFMIDDKGDETISAIYGAPKASTSEVIHEARRRQTSYDDDSFATAELADPVASLEHDPYLSVGKVLIRTEIDDDGSVVAEMPSGRAPRKGTGFKDLDSDYYEEFSDSDEDGAFDDYLAQIMGANGDAHDDYDSQSDNDNYDIYFSDEDDIDDVHVSDQDGLEGDDDGLEDILAFTQNQQKSFADLDVPPTKTLRAKGRTKKLRLEFEEAVDAELRESLLEQFQYQKKSRRDKKLRKKERLKMEGLDKKDLFVKYDYSLHIKDIKGELEDFLQDADRENVSFPPLDPHGNKTISKLAKHYNMKCTRCGNGRHIFMKISKARKTFHYLPDYNSINYVMKQRPIFKRSDVKKRTREEIEETDEKASGRRGPKNRAYVKEGDVVGGEAPEIAQNNIGRQLLEKLGWVRGEGLGAHGNKGISVPLMATVKKSKTGLK
ncbi:hypothetical protein FT662_00525 [Candidozyma haemuli var. vulneris]|uniref:Protein SQS1 n=1 Tax=Candidozyma haemuli TaxID=45357 RepID=A0A2V1AQA2_9ASCO|nr:hypothetical protein CXQ85_003540 [[Candida] haemuloni]KAF3993605.1 hypothetical protein FT662_00525 [[Candida] haemuloni var. vulneris]PVH19686.1 hypothetical protein CXQ85_003540 [[Candida] haemuloni]